MQKSWFTIFNEPPFPRDISPHDNTIFSVPQWGVADAEVKVPTDENTELNGSPFKT